MKQRQKNNKKAGLWIRCCNEKCKKWRFVTEYQDSSYKPEAWFCSQNLNKNFSSCDIPQEKINENTIKSKHNPGTVVWAKIRGFPWWPAIVNDSPEKEEFYKIEGSNVPTEYNVTFFEEGKVEYAWVKPENIKPFKENDGLQPMQKAKKVYDGKDYADRLQSSLKLAKLAIALNVPERLKKYSFYTRFNQRKPEDLEVSISQNTEKKVRSLKRPKTNIRRIKYVTTNINSDRNRNKIKSIGFNLKKQKRELPNSAQDKQMTLRSSIFEFNQTFINPQRWNLCSIQ